MRASVLVVTEDRTAFAPWVHEQWSKQIYADKELVVVDSSRHQIDFYREAARANQNIVVIRALPGTSIGAKLNVAIEAASGSFVTRFDDDDWQNPHQLWWKATALAHAASGVVGFSYGFFLELERGRVHDYRGLANSIVPITCALDRDLARAMPFPNTSLYEDNKWLQSLLCKVKPRRISTDVVHSFWLRHGQNTTQRFVRNPEPYHMNELVDRIGLRAWGTTTEHLSTLRQRLQTHHG